MGSPLVMLVVDPLDGQIVDVNDAALGYYGYSRDEFLALRISDVNQLSPEAVRSELISAQKKRTKRFDVPHRLADGTVRAVEVHAGLIEVGGRTLLLSTVLDRAEQMEAEEVSAYSAVRNRLLFDSASDGMLVLDESWTPIEFNEAFAEMLGYDFDEIRALRPWDWEMDLSSKSKFLKRWPEIPAETTFVNTKWRRRDGTSVEVELHINLIEWSGVRGVLLICREITEARAERFQAIRWRRAFEFAEIGVTLVDDSTNTFLEVNRSYAANRGYAQAELIGASVYSVYPVDERDAVDRLLQTAVQQGHASMEAYQVRKDGTRFPVWIETTAIPGPSGSSGTRISFTLDITERKNAVAALARLNLSLEQEVDARTFELRASNEQIAQTAYELERTVAQLQLLNEELRSASEANSRFLSSVSHEFRTPLNAVIGFSQLMLDGLVGELNDQQVRQLTMVNESGHQLLELVNDVLEFSRLEGGGSAVSARTFSLAALARESLESVATMAAEKGLKTELRLGHGVEMLNIQSDPDRIRRILQNLLGNAVKFTVEGTVSLQVSRTTGDSISFAVRDSGPGISQENHDSIFEMFSLSSAVSHSGSSGTGLGLAISRALARGLGGTITLRSSEGQGSVFTLTVPATLDA